MEALLVASSGLGVSILLSGEPVLQAQAQDCGDAADGQLRKVCLSHALFHQYCSQVRQYFKHSSETLEILLVNSSGLRVSVMLSFINTALR